MSQETKDTVYLLGQIDGRLGGVEESLKRIEGGFVTRVNSLEARLIELEAAKNQGIGKTAVLVSIGGTVGGFIASLLQKHFTT